ncbi:Cleavage and polyadenylation specificity factor subunit CG7185 [Eumeta japonica]|uniref:Cleavage and polyadenylation specificity factor subunit CG7185 n=1 Tax=Eumeta variegata TaxID=151549 RepID=A0A4C1XIU7_EUMVA|nr:Cleavage and polyadenylation specificity factor subunit CG7185 [Eumeta japonica]
MADGGVDIDLYADDIEADFNRTDEFGGENVDLYDDVLAAPGSGSGPSGPGPAKPEDADGPGTVTAHPPEETNGATPYNTAASGPPNAHHGRRFQLYVGNLTWLLRKNESAGQLGHVPSNGMGENQMAVSQRGSVLMARWRVGLQYTTDQDIASAIADVGVADFQDVKFFENRANGQSKGFCVVSLGSEQSVRLVLDRLPKKDIHGHPPVVTMPTKQV